MDKTAKTPRARAPRWMRIAFGVSLALNLAVAGMLVGTFARFGGPPSRASSSINYAMPYMRALPRETQRDIFRAMRDQLPAESGGRQARRALYAEMIEALKADPFEPARVQSILELQNTTAVAVQSAAHTAWLDRVSAMSFEDRIAYAGAVSEVMRHGKRKKDKPGKD
ncbi:MULTISPECIES: periplasmic heavy metal sensor [Roseobacteraceae]|uniref:Heavy-metal resistance n=1 Tax=Pseudosulfitobacter pseudonitzschiae TaxID=1402135 RepID=A0A221K1K3_9RHOB|nr:MULTISPECIES: periplasmic heavy metal sensor [Roseobacteraceae]ASM72851.1 heavy-metal resistance [Pseudosulfitobacter pseudonitzschiae]